jgi:hypothetical protein
MENNMGNNIGFEYLPWRTTWGTTLGQISTKENNIGNFMGVGGGDNIKENNIGNFIGGTMPRRTT